jgi:hypothetical protein
VTPRFLTSSRAPYNYTQPMRDEIHEFGCFKAPYFLHQLQGKAFERITHKQ